MTRPHHIPGPHDPVDHGQPSLSEASKGRFAHDQRERGSASRQGTRHGFWAEQAWVGEPADAGQLPSLRSRVRIEVTDGQIMAVQQDVDPEPDDVRLRGVVFPGFANVHSHAFHRALRGRTHDRGGTFWTWRDEMYRVAGRLTPDSYYELARAVYAEMVLAGVTVVGEFHYVHHNPDGTRYADPNAMGHALIHAAADAGIRLTLLDTCYLHGGIGAPLEGAQLRFGDGGAEQWIDRVEQLRQSIEPRPAPAAGGEDPTAGSTGRSAGLLVGAAVHSVRAVPPPAVKSVTAWTREVHLPLHVHLSEQVDENVACLDAYGQTPTQVLADAAALGPSTTAVHATHLTGDDVRLLGSAGVHVCSCPSTEQDLADGISPMGDLDAAGAAVCLGSDQHAAIDLLGETRRLEMHERLASGRRGRFTPTELVAALTHRGHTALGWPSNGRISPGAAADLVAVRADSVHTAGCDPAQLVMAATAADVQTVVVGGNIVVDNGEHLLGDIGALYQAALLP